MRLDPTITMILIIAAAAVVVALIGWAVARKRRSHELRERFGSEYDYATRETGSRAEAERELREREEHARNITIQPLSLDDRKRFETEWEAIEARFVERPTTAVLEADELIREVLRLRGFPIRNFDELVADLSVHQPDVVEDFRAAHSVLDRSDPGEISTEDLRQAMLHYRRLFAELVGQAPATRSATDREVPIEETRERDAAPRRTAAEPGRSSTAPRERPRRRDRPSR
jgi:hypothetical protein